MIAVMTTAVMIPQASINSGIIHIHSIKYRIMHMQTCPSENKQNIQRKVDFYPVSSLAQTQVNFLHPAEITTVRGR